MAASPLAGAITSGSSEKKSRKGLAGLAILAFAGAASVGTVFAANVTLAGGTDIAFAQGVQTIAACDTAIGVELTSAFDGTAFEVDSISLTGVATGCSDQDLTLKLYDSSNTLLATATGELASSVPTTVSIADGSGDDAIVEDAAGLPGDAENVYTGFDTAVNVSFLYESGQTPALLATNAAEITIEIN